MTGMIEVLDGSTENYDPPGTKPEFDIILHDDFSMVVFYPTTVLGSDWLDEHLPDDCPRIGEGYAVESRYATDIVEGIIADGLNLKMGVLN